MDDKDVEQDFDYDLYKIKYGIDLGHDSEDVVTEQTGEQPVKKNSAGEKSGKKVSAAGMELYDWLQCIVAAILCGILIFIFVGRIIGVEGNSMLNTLQNGDKVIMSGLFYQPKYGDIVVLKTEAFGQTPIVKRVIATEGQTINIDFSSGEVTIDDHVILEDYIREPTTAQLDFVGPITIPPGFIFVMGDNRNESTDSRSSLVGLVDTREILGKVLFIAIPGKNTDGSTSWDRIGSVYK